jgi:hypothetical protein
MSATEAIVQFIGIIMMTAGVPNDPGVHAIVPRIQPRIATFRGVPVGGRNVVEAHTAVVLYETAAKIGISNWTPVPFRGTWEYVVLNGERLQFVTGAMNPAPAVPRDLPRACPTAQALQSNYQAPQYPGATAVVDIDEGFLDVCLAQPKSGQANGRADTRLFLKTNGALVLVGTKPNEPAKTITLQPDARVYIANVPPHHLDIPSVASAGGLPHYKAYDAMVGTTNCTPNPDTGAICRLCDTSEMKTAGKGQNPLPQMVNSECSNTQWP